MYRSTANRESAAVSQPFVRGDLQRTGANGGSAGEGVLPLATNVPALGLFKVPVPFIAIVAV